MTVDEKRQKALSYCESMKSCGSCPMCPTKDEDYAEFCAFKTYSEAKLDECLERFHDSKKAEAEPDDAVHPKHYQLPGGMRVVDIEQAVFGRAALMEHCLCSATEYILRHKRKNGLEDIRKAYWWIGKYLDLAEMDKE